MKSIEELRRDPSVIWMEKARNRLYYFRENQGLKDFFGFDMTTGALLEVRPAQSIEANALDQWFLEFLDGRH